MQKFNKIGEEIVRSKNRFLLLRKLRSQNEFSNLSDARIIDDVIKSEFHNWLGEKRAENSTLPKFYGYFDSEKLKVEDYKKISFETFRTKLFSTIESWNDESVFEENTKKAISENINTNSQFYHLDLDEFDESKKADWHNYSIFIGFISVDRENKVLTLIEFGED